MDSPQVPANVPALSAENAKLKRKLDESLTLKRVWRDKYADAVEELALARSTGTKKRPGAEHNDTSAKADVRPPPVQEDSYDEDSYYEDSYDDGRSYDDGELLLQLLDSLRDDPSVECVASNRAMMFCIPGNAATRIIEALRKSPARLFFEFFTEPGGTRMDGFDCLQHEKASTPFTVSIVPVDFDLFREQARFLGLAWDTRSFNSSFVAASEIYFTAGVDRQPFNEAMMREVLSLELFKGSRLWRSGERLVIKLPEPWLSVRFMLELYAKSNYDRVIDFVRPPPSSTTNAAAAATSATTTH